MNKTQLEYGRNKSLSFEYSKVRGHLACNELTFIMVYLMTRKVLELHLDEKNFKNLVKSFTTIN